MAIRWRRPKRTATRRGWYLQDSVTESTLMRVEWQDNSPGWVYIVCTPATMPNWTSTTYPDSHSAKLAAAVWWIDNKEHHKQLWR